MENYRLLNKTEAICWHCENCSPLKCEWVLFGGDVKKLPKGAKTKTKYLRYRVEKEPAYLILECPNFIGEKIVTKTEKKKARTKRIRYTEMILNCLGNRELSGYELIEQLQHLNLTDRQILQKIYELKSKGKIKVVRKQERKGSKGRIHIYKKADE